MIKILKVQENGVVFLKDTTESFQKFKIFGDLNLTQKALIEKHPDLPWELEDEVRATLSQMYGDRAIEVKKDQESRRIIEKDKDGNPLANYTVYND